MASFKHNLTMAFIEKIVPPATGRDYYYDTEEKGLVLDVTPSGAKTFYLYKKINGKPQRIKIDSVDNINIKKARDEANTLKTRIRGGENPNAEKGKVRNETTLKELFEKYMTEYSKKEKKSWQYDEREIPKFLSHWFNRKISEITKEQVQSLHNKMGEDNGLYQANRLLERLKSMYNKAIKWGWKGENPCNGITKFKEVKRDRFIRPEELPAFFKALEEEENEEARNYIWMSLLTGARKSNVLAMRWDEIDMTLKMWRIPETKNGEPLNVPLVDKAIELLKGIKKSSPWVFPSDTSKTGYLQDPKKAWKRILDKAGISNLRIHDIRRTLGSYQAMAGASLLMIGKSLGHKSQQATEIYARLTTDPIRNSMQVAVDNMLKYREDE